MLAFIGLIVLLQFFRPDPFDAGSLLRICVYGVLGFVCPAAIIPVGVCWFSCWLIREVNRDRKAKAQAKRVCRPAPRAIAAGCPPTKPPTPAAETARQKVSRIFWGYAVLVALCSIVALTTQHAP